MQIEKSRGLIHGLRKHLSETGRGVTSIVMPLPFFLISLLK